MSETIGLLASLSVDCDLHQKLWPISTGTEIEVLQNVVLKAQIRDRAVPLSPAIGERG